MFGKKFGFSPNEKKAKLSALHEAKGMAEKMMKGDLKGAKEVSVFAKDKKGLEKGLDVAKKVVGENPFAKKEKGENPFAKKNDLDSPFAKHESEQGADGDSDEELADGMEAGDEYCPPGEEGYDSPEEEDAEAEAMSDEELDAEIEKLMALKRQHQSR